MKKETTKTDETAIADSLLLADVTSLTRNEVVPLYISLIKSNLDDLVVQAFNKKILSKWTLSGLEYIKEKAWRNLYCNSR